MPISRYSKTKTKFNDDLGYREMFSKRYGRRQGIPILETTRLSYPSFEEILDFGYVTHVWGVGDRYYKLSALHYGSESYWWVIAWFNQKPTEQHIKVGDLIRVPKPLVDVLSAIGL
tara:strand:+ start:769 stop:1116 length:348 start_codon:yes stop_codon:yes gene_type:complete